MTEYIQHGLFAFSRNGSMMTTVATLARHSDNLDKVLQSEALLQVKLYASKREAMKRLTEYDAATPEADAGGNQKEKWVLLPKFIPLPAGTELPPCILGSALIGSKDLIQICKERWGVDSLPFFENNLVREWLDAVAEHSECFDTVWYLAGEYMELFDHNAQFIVAESADSIRLAWLRLAARLHVDAVRFGSFRDKLGVSEILAAINRSAGRFGSLHSIPGAVPPAMSLEVITMIRPTRHKQIFQKFAATDALMPAALRPLRTAVIVCSGNQTPEVDINDFRPVVQALRTDRRRTR